MSRWRKSSYSAGGNCVEVSEGSDKVSVRDSKDPDGPVLTFDPSRFSDFINAVKQGHIG